MNSRFVKAQSDNLPAVTADMIAEFFATNECFNLAETRGVKTSRSKREEYGDNAIGFVKLKRERNICIVQGKICPEHKVRNKPYTVICKVDEERYETEEMICKDCAASAGGCKLTVAFLMWLHRRSAEPESTSTECYWKKSKLAQIGTSKKSITVEDMCGVKKKSKFTRNELVFKCIRQEMQKRQSNFQISPHCILFNGNLYDVSLHKMLFCFAESKKDTPEDFLNFARNLMSNSHCQKILMQTRNQADSKLWTEMRYGRVTASKIYEIVRCKTANGTLVQQIIGASKVKDSEAMARGTRLEKQVLAELKNLFQDVAITDTGLFLDPKYPIIGASPDAIGPNFVVEIKCPMSSKTEKKYINVDGQINNRYLAQIQLQMFMAKKERGYFCVADQNFEKNKVFKVIPVVFDKSFVIDLIEKSTKFWKINIFPILYKAVKLE